MKPTLLSLPGSASLRPNQRHVKRLDRPDRAMADLLLRPERTTPGAMRRRTRLRTHPGPARYSGIW
jgi:hypothetical protein